MKLEILRTETANTYTTTALASTVIFAEYSVDGESKTMTAAEGCALVLVVDGVQRDLLPGCTYEVEDSFTLRVIAPKEYDCRVVLPREVRMLDGDKVSVTVKTY